MTDIRPNGDMEIRAVPGGCLGTHEGGEALVIRTMVDGLRVFAATLSLSLALASVVAAGEPVALDGQLVTDELVQPVFLTHAPDDFDRVFVLERIGRIRIISDGA